MKNKVLIKIFAGGGWEGHVAYTAFHPENSSISSSSSSIDEIKSFCAKHGLDMDDYFISLIKRNLVYDASKGLIIPLEFIDENLPISSANIFLKQNFAEYY